MSKLKTLGNILKITGQVGAGLAGVTLPPKTTLSDSDLNADGQVSALEMAVDAVMPHAAEIALAGGNLTEVTNVIQRWIVESAVRVEKGE